MISGHLCAIYPKEGAFTPVSNYIEAVDFLRTIVQFLIETEQNHSSIVPNFREYTPVSPLDIYKLLPGDNCTACGYATCLAFAAALARQFTSFTRGPHLAYPIEEKSTFQITDKSGKPSETVSFAIDTHSLRKEVREKTDYIQFLKNQLAAYEYTRKENIDKVNSSLIVPLSKREIEVLQLVAQGATHKQISEQLFISAHTVKSHITNIFDKLGVNDRTQASVWAAQRGVL